jgi:CRISPR system Cascade subunit CasC
MQKTAVFGGTERIRISSQCLKYAMRNADEFLKNFQISIRTRRPDLFIEELKKDKHFLEEVGEKTIKAIVDAMCSCKAKKKKQANDKVEGEEENDDGKETKYSKNLPVGVWSPEEVKYLCKEWNKHIKNNESEKEKNDIKKKSKNPLTLAEFLERDKEYNKYITIDIALFGRMVTSGAMKIVDGSMSVAHAFTTHTAEPEIDWFTATDSLSNEAGGGSAHIGQHEFSAGVFYKYASINLKQLEKNTLSPNNEEILKKAAEGAWVFAVTQPTGMQHSFAAYNLPDYVLIVFSDVPISLANAFEEPVEKDENGGFLNKSIKKLEDYFEKISQSFGLDGEKAVFSTNDNVENKKNIKELKEWIMKGGE